MKILCFGSMNIDHTYQVDHFLRPGETQAPEDYALHAGGKGLNQCIALARAGAEVYMAGCVGADGGALLEVLRTAGARTDLVRECAAPTGHAVIQVDRSGQNCILICHGANYCVTPEQIDATLSRFAPGDALLLQNEINHIDLLARRAKEAGLEVWLNPSPITGSLLSGAAIRLADGLVVNEVELAALSGRADVEEGIAELGRRFPCQRLVLTLGERGSVFIGGGERVSQAAYPVEAADTTGAGDTFLGYFLAKYTADRSAAPAMRYAAKAAALAVTRQGAAEAIPTLDEVERAF